MEGLRLSSEEKQTTPEPTPILLAVPGEPPVAVSGESKVTQAGTVFSEIEARAALASLPEFVPSNLERQYHPIFITNQLSIYSVFSNTLSFRPTKGEEKSPSRSLVEDSR
ncbi:MAG: hypothetical protein HYV40_02935 [Candidatus Levybacteria bacterium]|nr:hypothetical protein [Candidatus Levybacteria bacterium]